MRVLKKYFRIYTIYFKSSIARDISFRFSFVMSFIGSFCFVALNFFLIYFLFQKIQIAGWGEKQILVLLGNFYILSYSIFFFFWRGFTDLIRNIRTGAFDFTLVRPADSQFLVSILGGGLHNMLAMIFGLIVLIASLINLQVSITPIQIVGWAITLLLSILACYSYIFLLITLNFKFGYLEEIINLSFSFQDFSRYPTDAFTRLPIFLLIFAIPFSSLTTVPSLILINKSFPIQAFLIFTTVSIIFILLVRTIWKISLKNYTSSS